MKHGKILSIVICLSLLVAIFACGLVIFAAESVAPGSKGVINVYLIGGQSNAVGYSQDIPEDAEADARFTEGFDNVLYFGRHENDPMMSDFTETKVKLVDKDIDRTGAEIGIASVLGNSDEMSAVIKCAYGSTKLYPERYNGAGATKKTWTSPSYLEAKGIEPDSEIGLMYTYFIETVTAGIEKLAIAGYTPVIKGMLWMQGESETNDAYADEDKTQPATTAAVMSAEYYNLLTALLEDIKEDVGAIASQDLTDMPFGMSLVSPAPGSASANNNMEYVNTVNAAMERLASEQDSCFTIDPTTAYGFGQHDTWHYNANTQQHIGEQFIAGATGKNLVTFDGAFAKMNSTLAAEGESVTVKFEAARGYDVDAVTVTRGGSTAPVEYKNDMTYTFTMPAGEVRFNITAYKRGIKDVVTEYGTIPKEYADAENYPWVVFNKDKEFVGAAIQFTRDVGNLTMEAGDGVCVLLRRNVDLDTTGEVYGGDYLSRVNGSITVDLGGNTVSYNATGGADAFIRLEATVAGYSTTLTLKNGKIKAGLDPVVRFVGHDDRIPDAYKVMDGDTVAGYNGADEEEIHNLTAVLSDLDISWTGTRGQYSMMISGTSPTTPTNKTAFSANNSLFVEDCDFDYGTSVPNATTGYVYSAGTYFPVDITVKGGSVKSDSMNGFAFHRMLSGSVTYAPNESGEYTALVLKNDEYNIPTQTFTNDKGEAVKYLFEKHERDYNVYTLGSGYIATIYGNIPENDTNPWVVFTEAGDFIGSAVKFSTEVAAIATGYDATSKAPINPVKSSVIYLRKDTSFLGISQGKGAQQLTCVDGGKVVIDLGGHTLTTADYAGADCFIRLELYQAGFNTTIVLKNGTIHNGNNSIVRFAALSSTVRGTDGVISATKYKQEAANGNPHVFDVTIENINATLDSNYSPSTNGAVLMNSAQSGLSDLTGNKNNVTVRDCNFDLSNWETVPYIVNAVLAVSVNMTVEGGTITATRDTAISFSKGFISGGGNRLFDKGSDGEYLKFITKYGDDGAIITSPPSTKYIDAKDSSIKDLRFVKLSKDETNKTYTYVLASLVTDYGTITSTYASILDYPIVVFKADGTCVIGTTDFTRTASQNACAAGDGAVILFRTDMNFSSQLSANNSLSNVDGTITVDLGGHTVEMGTKPTNGRDAFIRLEPAVVGYTTHIILKNGTVFSGDNPIVRFAAIKGRVPTTYTNTEGEEVALDYWNNTSPDLIHNLTVTLDGLDIKFGSTAGTYLIMYNQATSGYTLSPSAANNTLILNNCNIDFNDPAGTRYIFTNHASLPADVVIKGGSLSYNDTTKISWTRFLAEGTLTVSKNDDGKYFEVILPDDMSIDVDTIVKESTVTVGDKIYTYALMKKSSANGYTTYTFRPKELSSIKVSTNTTLYSNFIFKAHVTALDTVVSVELGGKTYSGAELEALREGEVFVIPVEIAAYDAMDEVILKVNAKYGETYSGTWRLGVVKYADKALADSSLTEASKSVIEAMLSYVNAAYGYFNTQGTVSDGELAEANAAIEMLLGTKYDLANTPEMKESAVNETPTLTAASVILGSEIKFYFVTDGTYGSNLYKFVTESGRSLKTEVNGNVIEVTTYAFALRETLIYTIDGTDVIGRYNLKSYYDYMAGEGEGTRELMTLLERLWWYSESAEDYKNSVAD